MRFLIFLIFLIILYSLLSYRFNHNNKGYTKVSYFRFDKSASIKQRESVEVFEPFAMLFDRYNISKASSGYYQATIIFFNLLTDYLKLYKTLIKIKKPCYIYSLRSIDILANKAFLPKILDRNKQLLHLYTPKTYVFDDSTDMKLLEQNFDEDKLYIMKKNIQRQKGCTITNNWEYIQAGFANKYVVCQELLMNPYLVNGLKINIRYYLLIVIKDTYPKFLLYNNGFMYYTPKKFVYKSTDKDRHITTGYIDRRVYEINPLTIRDFQNTLSVDDRRKFDNNVKNMFKYITGCFSKYIYEYDRNHHLNFVILGCDVAVDKNLGCKIMELNKGPDLSFKDERDKSVKYNLIDDTLREIGLIHGNTNNFIVLN